MGAKWRAKKEAKCGSNMEAKLEEKMDTKLGDAIVKAKHGAIIEVIIEVKCSAPRNIIVNAKTRILPSYAKLGTIFMQY